MKNLLLMTSHDEIIANGSPDAAPIPQQSKGNGQWETLELYLVSILFILFAVTYDIILPLKF